MSQDTEFPNREVYAYARLLLQKRRLELQAVALKHRRGRRTVQSDYLTCRRSLLQAINELETLLRTDPEGCHKKQRTRPS